MTLIETKARQHEQTYSGNHRKLLGTHYTPDSVVDYIVNRTLRPYLESPDLFTNIRILDPACGSGLFLLKAYDVLADYWKKTFGSFTLKDAQHLIENHLFGIDIDEQAVQATRKHLLQKASLADVISFSQNIVVGDALCLRPFYNQMQFGKQSLPKPPFGKKFLEHSFDCILGNPPYVRIQNTPLEKRQRYISAYTTAVGRFDISSLFFELSDYLLKENGRLGFIVSNKILSTSGAKKLRNFLLTHFAIEEIVDLSDTKLFDAAVLPLIFLARRTKERLNHIAYTSITESHRKTDTVQQTTNLLELLKGSGIPLEIDVSVDGRIFKVQRFFTTPPSKRVNVWTFHNERENALLSKLRCHSAYTIGDLCEKISVGLKTTADSVFIKPMTESFIKQEGIEKNLVFPVIESHNVNRWSCSWNSQTDLYVLYPHVEQNGKVIPVDLDEYPRAKNYLEGHRPQLEKRSYIKDSQRQWYEIWVHQSPGDFRQRKIITPDIASHNRFALDENGFFVNGTCYYLILKDKSDISYYSILGLLNSKVIEYFHKTTSGNSLYAKRFRYWTSYISIYPVAKRLFDSTRLATQLVKNVSRLLNNPIDKERTDIENENDNLCYQLFDITKSEIQEIETTLSVHRLQSSKKGIIK
ncbi:MAG TPA: Eco57I restriction-modification methylase domain-containing protein [Candidatus Wunengus sp. YC60]|uniref:Eco57I restriction-modification methylase domain-containing protein n=1 Tax=Candidatus Wunengus sp. YC60 TaxID=3367697 RepID=UPI004029F978